MQNRHGYDNSRLAEYPTDILHRLADQLRAKIGHYKAIKNRPPDMNSKHIAAFEWQSLLMCEYHVNCELLKRGKLRKYSEPQELKPLLSIEEHN